MYTTIKIIHASSAFISIIGFFIRGIFMIRKSNLLNTKVTPNLRYYYYSAGSKSQLLKLEVLTIGCICGV